jgi:hypothetical protein
VRSAHDGCVSAEAGHAHHAVALADVLDPLTYSVYRPRDLVTHYGRQLRCIGIKSHSSENVGKVDPGSLDPDPHLTGRRLRIRCFAELEHIWFADLRNPNLLHLFSFSDFGPQSFLPTAYRSCISVDRKRMRPEIGQKKTPDGGRRVPIRRENGFGRVSTQLAVTS